jgi:hypothetical protein
MTTLAAGNRFEIVVSRDQNEIMRYGVFQNLPIAGMGKPISKSAFRFREPVAL